MTVTTSGIATTTTPDVDEITSVDEGRARIDDVDGRLLDLLAERRLVSQRIQELRVEAGGSRVEHSRENAILRRYADGLGEGGVALAMAVLDHCRGRRTASASSLHPRPVST